MTEKTASRHRAIQQDVEESDEHHPKRKVKGAMQAGARDYPELPFPKQHQPKPGAEYKLDPEPCYDAPFYRGSAKLEGSVAVITGGDSGIGRAVAILFAREGADVAIVYLGEKADAEKTKERSRRRAGECLLIAGDVTEARLLRAGRRQDRQGVRPHRRAGQQRRLPAPRLALRGPDGGAFRRDDEAPTSTAISTWRRPRCRICSNGSAIINTGSVTGIVGNKDLLDYSTTKGGIHAFTRSLATHLVPRGIRVNAVAPGPVWTPLNPADKEAQGRQQVRHRHGDEAPGAAGRDRAGLCLPRLAAMLELHHRRDPADHRRLFRRMTES